MDALDANNAGNIWGFFNHVATKCVDANALAARFLLKKEHKHESIGASFLAHLMAQFAEYSRTFKTTLSQNCTINQEDVITALNSQNVKGQFTTVFLRAYRALPADERAMPWLVAIDSLDDCPLPSLALVFDFIEECITHIPSVYFLVLGNSAYRRLVSRRPALLSSIELITIP